MRRTSTPDFVSPGACDTLIFVLLPFEEALYGIRPCSRARPLAIFLGIRGSAIPNMLALRAKADRGCFF